MASTPGDPRAPRGRDAEPARTVALAAACDALTDVGADRLRAHEDLLRTRLVAGLDRLPGVRTHRIWADSGDAVGVVAFSIDGRSTRTGQRRARTPARHRPASRPLCAHPLLDRFALPDGALRASFGVGTIAEDVDRLLAALDEWLSR